MYNDHVSIKQYYLVRWPIYIVLSFLVGLLLGSQISTSDMLKLGYIFAGLFGVFLGVLFFPKFFQYIQRESSFSSMATVIFMVFVSAGLVPFVWYISSGEPSTYLEDCKYLTLVVVPLGIVSGEAAYQNNRWDEMKLGTKVLSFGALILSCLICMFGFPAVKQLCIWLMNYSPESFWAAFALVLSFSIVPIALGFLACIVGLPVVYED